jgi:hypothetical protein
MRTPRIPTDPHWNLVSRQLAPPSHGRGDRMPVVSDQNPTTVVPHGSAATPRGARISISINELNPVIACPTGGMS